MTSNILIWPFFVISGMAAPLYDGIIEYEDGTPATQSQLAKDVCTFLTWSASPEMDIRKKYGERSLSRFDGPGNDKSNLYFFQIPGLKFFALMLPLAAFTWHKKRHYWSLQKSAKFVYNPRKY